METPPFQTLDKVYGLAKVKDVHFFCCCSLWSHEHPFCRNHGQRARFYNNSCRNVLPNGPFYNLFFSKANAIVI